jgi:hypothetical protein
MSEIKVDTLTGKTTANDITVTAGATATMSLEQGLVKAWVNFNGLTSGTTIRDSFNVSSNIDNAAGDYTTTFTNAMGNANFSPNSFAGTGTVTPQTSSQNLAGISTTTIRTQTYIGSAFDRAYTMNQVHGDLA